MKGKFKYQESRGLPGGPNEMFTYVTGVFSTEGYKRNSPDVNNPYNIIPSGNITMRGVDFPVVGTDNLGNTKMMMPGKDYKFPGDMVFEVPMAQEGIEVPKRIGARKNPDGSESTHLMATETLDGKNWFSFPTLFQDSDGIWIDMSNRPWQEAYEEAKRRGEVIEFGTDKEAAIKFGQGSWKEKMQMGGNVYPVNYVPEAQMGASLPGASGMMYAREGAPSNGKYAKKTLPSAQEGRTITIDEGEGNKRNILTDSSEYETLYNEGRIGIKNEDDSISMNPLNEVVVTNVDEEYPFYQNLSDEEKKYFNSDSPIGRQIRSKAKDNIGFNADKAKDFAMGWLRDLPLASLQAPQSALVEGVEGIRGNDFNILNALEPDKQRIPSETWGVENPYAAFAVDAFTDPETLMGMSLLKQPLQKGMKQAGRYLTEETALKNAYKLNPWAFKPNPEMGYRMLGKEGFEDALETGVLRAKPAPNQSTTGSISLARNTNRNPNTGKMQGALDRPYFADGFIDERYAADYMAAVNKAENNLVSIPTHKGIAPPQAGSIPLENATIYKKDWLKGYKPIEVPKSSSATSSVDDVGNKFKSEIDWRNWVKYKEDFDNNPDVINELINIERNAKANGTWMKNSDGSIFKGTPEQFVIQQSSNFKKAFPDYYGDILHHRSKNEFNAFDENKFGSTDLGYHGKGIYTSEDASRTARYGDKPYELYVNTRNKGVNPDYNEFYRKDLNESLNALEKVYLQQKSLPKDFPEFYPNIEKYNKDLDIKFEKDIRGLIQNKKQLDNYDLIKVGNEVIIPFDNPVKSAIGNILFDMTNPNMYKSILPISLGLGAASQIEQKQEGGEETSWTDYLNPMNWGVTNRDEDGDFKQAFRAARNAGDDEFMWHGTRYNTELAPTETAKPQEQKPSYNPNILKGLSEEQAARRQALLNAADVVANAQGNDENLRRLLVMSAVMESTLGADPTAYGRDYTRGPMSIDDIAYQDLFAIREGARGYTAQQKKNAEWLNQLGLDASNMEQTLRSDDPLAGMAAARLVYGRAPEALPSGEDPDAMYNYYLKYYNKGGVDKYGGADAHKKKFVDFYNQIYRQEGGEQNQFQIYKDYVYGVYDGTEMAKAAEKVYDKLNRVYYKEAKQSGTTVPNYILSTVMKQANN